MKNEHLWRPTKFVRGRSGLKASSDPKHVGRGSRFVADLLAAAYSSTIAAYAQGALLDLGCGQVPLYGEYRQLVESVTCVDRTAGEPNPFLDHDLDLNLGVPLESESFDTVLTTDVLEHIARPERLLGDVARVLRPGGHLLCGVPFLYWLHEQPHDYHRYTEFRLLQLFEDCGLTPVKIAPYGGAPEVLLDIIAKHLARSRLLSATWYRTAVIAHHAPLVAAISKKGADRFPLGYIAVAAKPRS